MTTKLIVKIKSVETVATSKLSCCVRTRYM